MKQKGRFRCLVIGGQSLLIRCTEVLLERGHDICGVVSSDVTVRRWAQQRALPYFEADAELAASFRKAPFDYLFSIVNLKVLPPELLKLPRLGAINFHDGPLPTYAGLNTPVWALLNGEREHGVSWHLMTQEVDAGDLLAARRFPIAEDETALTLNMKCFEAGAACFEELVDALASGEAHPQPQNAALRTFYGSNRRPEGGALLDWTRPGEALARLSRALDYGGYPNPLALPKLWLREEMVVVRRVAVCPTTSGQPPGTVLELSEAGLRVASATCDVQLSELFELNGQPLKPLQLGARFGVRVGGSLPAFPARIELTALNEAWAKHEGFWRRRLGALELLELTFLSPAHNSAPQTDPHYDELPLPAVTLPEAGGAAGDILLAAHALLFARLGGGKSFDLPFQSAALGRALTGMGRFFAAHVPLRVTLQGEEDFSTFAATLWASAAKAEARRSYARDLILRAPELHGAAGAWHQGIPPVVLERVASLEAGAAPPITSQALLTVVLADDGACVWYYDAQTLGYDRTSRLQGRLVALLRSLSAAPTATVHAHPLLAEADELELAAWNATTTPYQDEACVHTLFEDQVVRTPEAPALAFREQTLTYSELNARAEQLAGALRRRGIGPGKLVGVLLDRSVELVVALLGTLKAGAAYVPLDPGYPLERLHFMAEDARLALVLTQTRHQGLVGDTGAPTLALDAAWDQDAQSTLEGGVQERTVISSDLAYVIYTSGSTGKPKGVMVEHRNVVNFFAGMDARLGVPTPPGVWLALTSISFDISVLELFWTLARGFKVVLYVDEDREGSPYPSHRAAAHVDKRMDFSLFYFASDEGEHDENKYRLLLEGAAFADTHGFAALWTPERHFHAFGGLYPNPAVTAAALATLTTRVKLRAGSCVLPLHHPARIAEEWALVDNLSGGRVGVSFASGWQPDDFVLAPHTYGERHTLLERGIETVRALWRGEARTFPGPHGEVTVRTLPRPVQAELPTWLTAAGNPATFRRAGELGANLLTHLLGQSVEELAEKIALYREAWRSSGHPGDGQVTLMLHTFVAEDEATVRAQVKEPLKRYLRSATGLIRQFASSFPAFKRVAEGATPDLDAQFEALPDEDMDALLEHAFERYYATSGLFGTPKGCIARVNELKGIGVDEVACLIDFGVPTEIVLAHLPTLARLQELANTPAPSYTLPNLVRTHRVTHLQCTPALATMLTLQPEAREALRALQVMLVGGEALPSDLARTLHELVPGVVHNMYGPTETTIWSTSYRLQGGETRVPVGSPITNTKVYVLDGSLQRLPPGVPGELVIAGAGVVRGYLNRPETTAERFLPDPWTPGGRMYRTGDLACLREEGALEFLGRLDFQVKLRGYRIELGEIEAALVRHAAVQQAVVVAREDTPGDKRLVAYLISMGHPPTPSDLRAFLQGTLPDYMVPSAFVTLSAFPLTPNKKVDRRAFPAPEFVRPELGSGWAPPSTPEEHALAKVWEEVLGVVRVGVHDNFFELGGDSLLALHAMSQAVKAGLRLTLRQLFQHPTVAQLAELAARGKDAPTTEQGLVTGPVPLVPSQHRFFYERCSPDPHHWNHALLLSAPTLEATALKAAVREVMRHHDALRLRFVLTTVGWTQFNTGVDDPLPFSSTDLGGLPERDRIAMMERAIAELQGSLDLTKGPLLRVAHFDLGTLGHRLFVTMHHLVLDPISWRVFWEDFGSVYRQVCHSERPALPQKTASFRAWAKALSAHAQTKTPRRELAAWLDSPWHAVRPLPLDFPNDRFGDNLNSSYGVATAALDPEATRLLSAQGRVEEILVAALARAVTAWTGGEVLHLDLVGLNRAAPPQDLDLSRTIGYFVAYLPTIIQIPRVASLEEMLGSVAEQLRRTLPMSGNYELLRYLTQDEGLRTRLAGLPRAEVLLNYRGAQEHDESFLDPELWRPAYESRGPSHSPRGLRHHPLNIAADLMDDAFVFTFTYSKNLHRPATIEALAQVFVEEVHALVLAVTASTKTPHPYAGASEERFAFPLVKGG